MDPERLERFLREPENLFGPPKGRGYDYLGAALTLAALGLAALSGWCLLTAGAPDLSPALATLLLLVGAPFCLGVWFFWPINLLFGWLGAALVWFATLHTATRLAGLRPPGRAPRVLPTATAVAGWGAGVWLALTVWHRPG
jgi:hypothetical protein